MCSRQRPQARVTGRNFKRTPVGKDYCQGGTRAPRPAHRWCRPWRRARVVCCCGAVLQRARRVQGRCAWDTGRLTHVDRALWLNPRVSRFTSQARPVETQSCVSTLTPQRTECPYNSVQFQPRKGRGKAAIPAYSHTHSHPVTRVGEGPSGASTRRHHLYAACPGCPHLRRVPRPSPVLIPLRQRVSELPTFTTTDTPPR